jgi:hypothetical protein
MVRGAGIAADVLPFAIRPGEATELEVRSAHGVRQRVQLEPVAGAKVEDMINLEIRRGGELVSWSTAHGDPIVCDVWLAPGRYTLATRDRTPPTRAELTVGGSEGPPVRVVLR